MWTLIQNMNNRELKFRIWLKHRSLFFGPERYGYMGMTIGTNGEIVHLSGQHVATIRQDDYIVQQYLGIKDKNRKEIYEGDIVKCGEFKPVEVKYDDYFGGFFPFVLRLDEEKQKLALDPEVIGNIFETPDLLK